MIDSNFLFKTVVKTNKEIYTELYEKAKKEGMIDVDEFSLAIENLLISEGGYVMDTGCGDQARAIILQELVDKIKKHPLAWRKFMVA